MFAPRTVARLVLLPLLLVPLLLAAPAVAVAAEATVTADLNLRAGPGLDFAILATMPAGGTVALTGEEADGFYGVVFDDLHGWAFGEGLDFGLADPAPGATVVAAALNVRAAPGLDMDIVAILDEGARVAVVGGPAEVDGDTWVEVAAAGGLRGWVVEAYLVGDSAP